MRQVHVVELEEQGAGEPGQRREQDAGQDAVGEHVARPLRRVVGAEHHVAEAHGIRSDVPELLAGDGIQAHRHAPLVLVLPELHAVFFDDVRRVVPHARGHPARPHVGGLDDVVVDAEQLERAHLSPRRTR
jgi:hypothetical protein